MSRPVTGKLIKSQMKQKQKNGDVYVYERESRYDPEVGYTRTISYKLIGKIKKGTTEIVPTRPRRRKTEPSGPEMPSAESAHVGATELLELVGRESGIDEDIDRALSEGHSKKVITAARYWVANPGSLVRIGKWQRTHPTPCETELTRSAYHKLFKELGADANSMHQYYKLRSDRAGESDVLAYDSTTMSTYSDNLKAARQGFNKAHDGLDTIKLLTLYSLKTHQPVAMATQPGNIPDVVSVQNALKELKWLRTKSIEVVTDNGFCSEENISRYVRAHIKFLTLIRTDAAWIRKLLDENRGALGTYSSICPWDASIHGICVPVKRRVTWERQRTQNGRQKGDEMSRECRFYVFLYFNQSRVARDEARLAAKLTLVKEQIESGVSEFKPAAQKFIDRFFTIFRRGQKIRAEVKEEVFAEAGKYFGCFALVSNKTATAFDALKYYRLREKIEEIFRVQKTNLDGEKPRVWYDDNLKGRLFCQFVALGYWCFLRDLIKDVKALAGKEVPDETEEGKGIRKALINWLRNTSLVEVLDWFDCIELTRLKGAASNINIRTETTKRDRLFLSMVHQVIEERKKAAAEEKAKEKAETTETEAAPDSQNEEEPDAQEDLPSPSSDQILPS